MVYLITYDINTAVKNYDDLYAAIKGISGDFQHPLESTWLVSTDEPIKNLYDVLRPLISDRDHLLILRMNSKYYGWLSKNVWDWLKSREL